MDCPHRDSEKNIKKTNEQTSGIEPDSSKQHTLVMYYIEGDESYLTDTTKYYIHKKLQDIDGGNCPICGAKIETSLVEYAKTMGFALKCDCRLTLFSSQQAEELADGLS